MELSYRELPLSLKFEKSLFFKESPGMILRSVLGMKLKKTSCSLKKNQCHTCKIVKHCPYGFLFETPEKAFEGSSHKVHGNHGIHPFIVSSSFWKGEEISKMPIYIRMYDSSFHMAPSLYYALVLAGEDGLFREREKFEVESLMPSEDCSFYEDKVWQLNPYVEKKEYKKILIQIKTPLRIQKNGQFLKNLSYEDILDATWHRMSFLLKNYGKVEEDFEHKRDWYLERKEVSLKMKENIKLNIYWSDSSRWSSRQQQRTTLGGFMGEMEVSGFFTPFEESLLQGGSLFHIGKNTSMGLGKINVLNYLF